MYCAPAFQATGPGAPGWSEGPRGLRCPEPRGRPRAVTALTLTPLWAQTLAFLAQNQQRLRGPHSSIPAGP